jgi:hypothetical protein
MKQSYLTNGVETHPQVGEYITLEEALKVTGLSEKTLKCHMRGAVPKFGRNAWDRQEFFDYWRKSHNEKQKNWIHKERVMKDILENAFQ